MFSRRAVLGMFVLLATVAHSARAESHATGGGAAEEQERRAFFKGLPPTNGSLDIGAMVGNTSSACQGTPIENTEISPGLCRVAIFTAAHCVAAYLLAPESQRKFTLPQVSGPSISFAKERVQIYTRSTNLAALTSVAGDAKPGDSALIAITAPATPSPS